MNRLDHVHTFNDRKDERYPALYATGMVTLYCYQDDCYKGLDREMYPPKLIGRKLYVRGGSVTEVGR